MASASNWLKIRSTSAEVNLIAHSIRLGLAIQRKIVCGACDLEVVKCYGQFRAALVIMIPLATASRAALAAAPSATVDAAGADFIFDRRPAVPGRGDRKRGRHVRAPGRARGPRFPW